MILPTTISLILLAIIAIFYIIFFIDIGLECLSGDANEVTTIGFIVVTMVFVLFAFVLILFTFFPR